MGAKYRSYSVTTSADVLYQIYNFIANSGQNCLQIVQDTGVPALYKQGTGYVASWASSADSPSGSYLVVEPVTAYPGGGKWQAYITLSTNTLRIQVSMNGQWSNGGAGPGAFGGSAKKTPLTDWNDTAAPGGGAMLYVGASNTETYNGGANVYTYLYAALNEPGGVADLDQMFYTGGYIPFDAAADTKPFVFLSRTPDLESNTASFGKNTSDANCLNRTQVEYAQTTDLAAAGYCRVGLLGGTPAALSNCRDYNSKYPGLPLYVFTQTNFCLGYFGSATMLAIDTAKVNLDTNSTPSYIVFNDVLFKFDTAL